MVVVLNKVDLLEDKKKEKHITKVGGALWVGHSGWGTVGEALWVRHCGWVGLCIGSLNGGNSSSVMAGWGIVKLPLATPYSPPLPPPCCHR